MGITQAISGQVLRSCIVKVVSRERRTWSSRHTSSYKGTFHFEPEASSLGPLSDRVP